MKTFDGLSEKKKKPRQSAGRIKEDPADPMYNLQLLSQNSVPQHIKIRDELEKVVEGLLK